MWDLDLYRGELLQCMVIPENIDEIIRKNFEITAKIVDGKIVEILEWIQDHQWLPQQECKDVQFVELMLRINKFDVIKAKNKIEDYFRTLQEQSDIFTQLRGLKCTQEPGIAVGFPYLTPTYERVVLMKLTENTNPKNLDMSRVIKILSAMGLLALHVDKFISSRIIVDFQGLTFQHFLQIHFTDAWKLNNIYENLLKVPISGIELVNAPHFISSVLNLAKLVLKPKLFSRITVHSNLDSLYEKIPKSCLPSDYGGTLPSVNSMLKNWDLVIEEHVDFYEKIAKLSSVSQVAEDPSTIFGVQGTFKTLMLD